MMNDYNDLVLKMEIKPSNESDLEKKGRLARTRDEFETYKQAFSFLMS